VAGTIRPMPFLFGRAYRRLGTKYFGLYVVFEVVSAFVVCLATVGIFALYTETSPGEFWRVVAVAEGAVAVALAYGLTKASRHVRPIVDWVRDGGSEQGALEVWRCAVSLPRQLVVHDGWQAFVIVGLPVALYSTIEFELPAYSVLIIFGGSMVAVAYAAILHFFASELFLRPVLEDIARRLPPDFGGARLGVPLRWKLLGALPLINVITGVVASGLSTDGSASLDDLGLDVIVAVLVAFTVSLELTLLLTKSILQPVDDLLEATEAVKRGDLDARVPVVSGDEMGELAGSFNEMMEGLSERERLRAAFGSYVDPEVAERVLEEGELLEGQEREVTVMFVDLCDFTARAERSSARETVAFLNEFLRRRRAVRARARRSRQQVPRGRRSGGVRRPRAPARPRRSGGGRRARDRRRGRRSLRRRGADRDRLELRPCGRGLDGGRGPARVFGDRRGGQRGRPGGGHDAADRRRDLAHRSHALPAG